MTQLTSVDCESDEGLRESGNSFIQFQRPLASDGLRFVEVTDRSWRRLFDKSLDRIHYARSCQRVGRCMRLAIVVENQWAGGIVLGSTFPNVHVRDEFLDLKKYVRNVKERGLKNAWERNNTDYWTRLQLIVNHARTFVFPSFQGKGVGVKSHQLLLTEGVRLWEEKYQQPVAAMDTLCDHGDSKLFHANGWSLVGETKGYGSNPKVKFSSKSEKDTRYTNNVGLAHNGKRWVVWVKLIKKEALKLDD